ncbi:MAG: glutamate formimidoyltransferase [Anaerolineales bacterium]|jgi:glutamate formiminotransferase/formiminotetrahydrofolate cyclodeaminase
MSNPIVECIANFSEGRRLEVVEAIANSITSVKGVVVLDQHSDWDHNRTVITFVGPAEKIEQAAFQAIVKAGELIDLEHHTGEHPRIGATDVVPFVPISDIDMQDCVAMAERLGQRVGEELGIPVYLYEEAATRPERYNLENIRRGQYEALKAEIGSDPEREPDFGPARLGPAGATVIGARPPLIAYNVYLTSDEVEIAKKIARALRHSSGGLRYVKALGLLVDDRAQVSMNLTNYRKTPLARVVEFIRREAARYGVAIHHSELVGLIPQDALVDAAVWYTQMDQFEPHQVLEKRLYSALQDNNSDFQARDSFLEELAAGTPTPGGGSASAYSGAMGAALVAMVARLSMGKAKYAEIEEEMAEALEQAQELRDKLNAAVQEDAAAYEGVMAAYRRPKDDPQRHQAIQRTTLHAAEVPLQVGRMALQVLELTAQVAGLGNPNAITDVGTGALLAEAALSGAGYNVRINLFDLEDRIAAQSLLDELESLEERAKKLKVQVETHLKERAGLSLG